MSSPSAANVALPDKSPVTVSVPPVPSCTRGVRCPLDGRAGRFNADKPVLLYGSGKLVVARTVPLKEGDEVPLLPNISPLTVLCYRGHTSNATACKLSTSGCYVASGDDKGNLRVWAFDHPEHLAKYECGSFLKGPVRDVDWDMESKRLAVGGERLDARSECAKAISWDGVTAGQLAQFAKGRVSSVAFKPSRPFRIVTAGMDEAKTAFHAGPPFAKVPPQDNVPAEAAHGARGGVQCIRYSHDGSLVASVASDKALCLYEGKTLKLLAKVDDIHKATVYCVAWSKDDKQLLTSSGDGTCKLFSVSASADAAEVKELHTWYPAKVQAGDGVDVEKKVPVGGTQLGCAFVQGTAPVSVSLNGQISILPLPGSGDDKIRVLTGHAAPVSCLVVDKANGSFFTGDTDGILCRYDLKTTQPVARLIPPEGNADLMYVVHGTTDSPAAVSAVAVANGKLYSAGWDDRLYVADAKSGAVDGNPLSLAAQPVNVVAGTSLVVILTVKGLQCVDKSGKLSDMMELPHEGRSVCVAADDKTVYVGGEDCNIYVYEVSGGTFKQTGAIEGKHLKPVHALALSNDGSKLAAGDLRDVCVFDVKDGNKSLIGRGSWCFHLQRVTCLAWSPDDSVVASGGLDDSIYLWSLSKKMKRVHYPYAHRGGLTGLAFVGDRELLSVGADSVVNRWDVSKDVKEKFA